MLKSELISYINDIKQNITIALVPTMGALHLGHISLIELAKSHCDIVICSIFINPTQFDNDDDFLKYPRDLEKDIFTLKSVKCDILYAPERADLYIDNEPSHQFNFNGLDRYMEGRFRNNHFNGVATIINKLFKIIAPDKAFFGQKDLQQLQIIKYITQQMKLNIEIIGGCTIREKSGLAMSSRNERLTELELQKATLIYQSLQYVKKHFKNIDKKDIQSHILSNFNKDDDISLEYFEIVSVERLCPIVDFLPENQNAACIAASISGVRLIDNIIF